MFRKDSENNDEIDRAGKLVLRSGTADEKDIDAAASSAFMLTRIRARIAEAQRGEEAAGWQSLPLIAWRAIPAMALVATIAGGLMLWTGQSTNTGNTAGTPVGFGMYEEALADPSDPGVEQTILGRNGLSNDDVLTIVVERGNRENKK
jgi:hypothetical protein